MRSVRSRPNRSTAPQRPLRLPLLWLFFLLLLLPLGLSVPSPRAGVIINEVMYHAPDDLDELQYIELHNPDQAAVDLSGWAFTKGISFKFPAGSRIEPNGYVVVCRNEALFKQFYKSPVAGVFNSTIKHKGERIEISDATGKPVDALKFSDHAQWPTGCAGYSGSLERISPNAPGDDASNWASSPLSDDRAKPAGSPGRANACFSSKALPVIKSLSFQPAEPTPNEPILVAAEVEVEKTVEIADVTLRYRVLGPGFEGAETNLTMLSPGAGKYTATIPPQQPGRVVRFRVQARSTSGATRFFPAETEPRPARSVYLHDAVQAAKVPFGWILSPSPEEKTALTSQGFDQMPGDFPPPPEDEGTRRTRMEARGAIEETLDFTTTWYRLTANEATCDPATLAKLQPVFQLAIEERNALFQKTFVSAEELTKTLADDSVLDAIKRIHTSLRDRVREVLPEAQQIALADWFKPAADGPNPDDRRRSRIATSRVDVEGAWCAITTLPSGDLDPQRVKECRRILHDIQRERDAIAAEIVSGQGKDTAFKDQRERAEALGGRIAQQIRPLLIASGQARELDLWLADANAGTHGFRSPPLVDPFPPPGFGGPPGAPGTESNSRPASHRSAFVYYDPASQETELFDFVQISPRKGGQKVRFLKDQTLDGMTAVNLIFEGETASLVEPFAYEVYRRAGMAAERSWHVRLWANNTPMGYHILIEQPNQAFLRNNHVKDGGNLYKLLWFGGDVVGQHEKHTNTRSGHEDIVNLVQRLQNTSGDAQWELIHKEFDVPQVATYFAVNAVLSHWDGFFNNYFTYHDIHGTGRWTMYPWDQDSTSGLRAMGSEGRVFFDMPITFGMNGDSQPASDPGWWRPPGWFSGPLLANPAFRKVFLGRTREILENVFTSEKLEPVLRTMEENLIPEARFRAELQRQNPDDAVRALKSDLAGIREHIRKRREFLLAQDEIKRAVNAPPPPPPPPPRPPAPSPNGLNSKPGSGSNSNPDATSGTGKSTGKSKPSSKKKRKQPQDVDK